MIVFLTFSLISCLIIARLDLASKGTNTLQKALLIFFVCLFILFINILVSGGVIETFTSDEYGYYIHASWDNTNAARGAWYLVNLIARDYDISGEFFLKIISIPALLLTVLGISKLFNERALSLYILCSLPFLFFLAVMNLRDMYIFAFTVTAFLSLQRKSYFILLLSIFLLLYLRPLIVVLISLSIVFCYITRFRQERIKIKAKVGFLVFLIAIAFLGFDAVYKYYLHMSHLIESGPDVEHRTVLISENQFDSFITSFARYVFTPIPFSLFERLIYSGATEYGYVHDVVRLFNQIFYYIIFLSVLFLSVFRYGRLKYIFFKRTILESALLVHFLSYSVIYATHLGGVGHQRLKIPFQIAIVIIFFFLIKQDTYNGKREPK